MQRVLEAHHTLYLYDHDMDITDFAVVTNTIGRDKPEIVIHCAALTNVDRCAQKPDEALQVNGFGTRNVALACAKHNAAMLYVSTNEVFSGERTGGMPYLEYDPPQPANPYAYSKFVGEQAVRDVLPQHFIVRTAWLFAHHGKNFLQRIVGLAKEGKPLTVVTDEVANPTYVPDLAAAIAQLVQTEQFGTYHLVNEGAVSRYGFAKAILARYGMADHPITPIVKAQFNRPSRPPTYSALRNFFGAQIGVSLRAWEAALDAFVAQQPDL
ncbi:MAG: dTDP-4-dehydrorhamnose reductase [Anaerolineae bacterium]